MLPIWQNVNPVIKVLSTLPSRNPILLAELVDEVGDPDPIVPPPVPVPLSPVSGGVKWAL